ILILNAAFACSGGKPQEDKTLLSSCCLEEHADLVDIITPFSPSECMITSGFKPGTEILTKCGALFSGVLIVISSIVLNLCRNMRITLLIYRYSFPFFLN